VKLIDNSHLVSSGEAPGSWRSESSTRPDRVRSGRRMLAIVASSPVVGAARGWAPQVCHHSGARGSLQVGWSDCQRS
jgi:hypothetical protein